MATLNRNSATLAKKYGSHGATDITGFGILGHAKNLAAVQYSDVDLVIEALPIINKMDCKVTGMHNFRVRDGYSAETSGGLLAMIPPENVNDFVRESAETYG